MNKRQRNKLMMLDAILKVCRKHQSVWQGNVPFSQAVTELEQKRDMIRNMSGEHETIARGVKDQREIVLKELISDASRLGKVLRALSVQISDARLEGRNHVSLSEWKRMAMESRLNRLGILKDDLANHLLQLSEFGITQADYDNFVVLLDEYIILINVPRMAIMDRKMLTEGIQLLYSEVDELLNNRMDLIVSAFAKTDPVFVRNYTIARNVIDYGHTKPGLIFRKPERDDGSDLHEIR